MSDGRAASVESWGGVVEGTALAPQFYYHAVHQPGSRVLDCTSGCFLGATHTSLVVTHGNRLVVYATSRAAADVVAKEVPPQRHIDPLAGIQGGDDVLRALQVIPLNGTVLFVKKISSCFQMTPLDAPVSKKNAAAAKDFLFVFLQNKQYLLLDLSWKHGSPSTSPSSEFPAEAPEVVDAQCIASGMLNTMHTVPHSFVREWCTAHAYQQVVAIIAFSRIVTVLNFQAVIARYLARDVTAASTQLQRVTRSFDLHGDTMRSHYFGHNEDGTYLTPTAVEGEVPASLPDATASGLEAINFRIDEDFVHAVEFGNDGRLYVLFDERKLRQRRHVSVYERLPVSPMVTEPVVSPSSGEGGNSPTVVPPAPAPPKRRKYLKSTIVQSDVDLTAEMLMAMHNGVCVLGANLITFINGVEPPRTIGLPTHIVSRPICVSIVDDWRFLVGYQQNALCLASVSHPPSAPRASPLPPGVQPRNAPPLDIHVISNEVPSPAALSYIEGGYCFCGSAYGDSVLVNLLHGGHEVVIPNLGPVESLCPAAVDGVSQLVASTGGHRDGSLCRLRLSIDFNVEAELADVGSANHLWSMGEMLVMGFQHCTRVLCIDSSTGEMEELADTDLLDLEAESLLCASVTGTKGTNQALTRSFLLQVTTTQLRVVPSTGGGEANVINLTGVATHAHYNDHCRMLAVASGQSIMCVSIDGKGKFGKTPTTVGTASEVSCIYVTDAGEVVAGLWHSTSIVRISRHVVSGTTNEFTFAGPETLMKVNSLPRSVALLHLNCNAPRALVVGMADGSISFCKEVSEAPSPRHSINATTTNTNSGGGGEVPMVTEEEDQVEPTSTPTRHASSTRLSLTFSEPTTMTLGTQSVSLTVLPTADEEGKCFLLASGDAPCVLHMPKRNVRLVAVSAPSMICAAPFGGDMQIATVTQNDALVIGVMSSVTSLSQHRVLEAGAVQHLCNYPSTSHLVATVQHPSHDEIVLYRLPALIKEERRVVLADHEVVTAMAVATLGADNQHTSVVSGGPAAPANKTPFEAVIASVTTNIPEEREPQFSRLVVYAVSSDSPGALAAAGNRNHGASPLLQPASPNGSNCLVPVGAERELQGTAFSLCPTHDGRVLVGMMGRVEVFSWSFVEKSLVSESSLRMGLLVAPIRMHSENLFVAGDIRHSVTLLTFNDLDQLAVIGRDLYQRSVMDVAVCGREVLFSDDQGSIYAGNHASLCRVAEGNDEEESGKTRSRGKSTAAEVTELVRQRIKTHTMWHLGDKVTVLASGSLSSIAAGTHDTASALQVGASVASPILYGTTSGAVGSVTQIGSVPAVILNLVAHAMDQITKPLGGLSRGAWRHTAPALPMDSADTVSQPTIVDGEHVERFLALQSSEVKKQVAGRVAKLLVSEQLLASRRTAESPETPNEPTTAAAITITAEVARQFLEGFLSRQEKAALDKAISQLPVQLGDLADKLELESIAAKLITVSAIEGLLESIQRLQ